MGHEARLWWLGCALWVALGGHAIAQSDESHASDDSGPLASRVQVGLSIGGKVGAGLGAPFNELGGTPVLELELGYLPDLGETLGRQLQLFLSGQYVQPGVDGTAADGDPRLPGGESIGNSDETQTAFGLVLLGGVDVFVGPGALLAELSFGFTQVDSYIVRDTNLDTLSLSVGYRVML